jgi:predicted nucleotidyltransferase
MISAPNTILGIEYCKALKKLQSPIRPFPILRLGSSYHDAQLPEEPRGFSSASAIRSHLVSSGTAGIAPFVPEDVFSDLQTASLLDENDFSSCLYYALLGRRPEELMQYYEVSEEIAQKICREFPYFTDFSAFTGQLKTKQYTHARLRRALLSILLSIKKNEPFQEGNYLRLLGLKKEASHLLRLIPEQTGLHIITKPADAGKILSGNDITLYKKEINASQLYGFTACHKMERTGMFSGQGVTPNPENKVTYRELAASPVIL